MSEKKEFKITFDKTFKKINTEKTMKMEEVAKVLTFLAPKHIKKNLAKVLFKQKFGVVAKKVNSVTYKKIIKIRTKTRILKKFFFQLPEGFKLPE